MAAPFGLFVLIGGPSSLITATKDILRFFDFKQYMAAPFVALRSKSEEWWRWRELNPRPNNQLL